MHAVFLDYKTVDAGDLDLESIRAVLPEIKVYPYSTEAEVLDRPGEKQDILQQEGLVVLHRTEQHIRGS